MRYGRWLTLLMGGALVALGADPPSNAAYRATDDKLIVLGTDNDFQAAYDSVDNRLELRDASGNVMARVTDAGLTGIFGTGRIDVINGSYATQITSEATANRAVTFPDAAGQVTLLGQDIASSEIVDSTIVNADISPSAAIAASKLAAGTNGQALVTSGGAAGWGTVASAGITDGTIVDTDINASAAIAITKLSTSGATTGQVPTYNGSTIVWDDAASGSIGGIGPLVDNAIPRMDGTGGYTLQGTNSGVEPLISDNGMVRLRNVLVLEDNAPVWLTGENNRKIVWYTDDVVHGADPGGQFIRYELGADNTAETATYDGSIFGLYGYANAGGVIGYIWYTDRDPLNPFHVEKGLDVSGVVYAGSGNVQVTDSTGKVQLASLAQTSATSGQVIGWNGSTWAPQSGSADWGSPGAIGAVAPNTGNFTSLTAASLTLSTPLTDANVADTLTIGASSTVADGALSANVAHLNAAETIASDWVNTANPWADNEVSDTLTASTFSGNYVASVANGLGITGGAAGSNAAALTLRLDETAALSGDHGLSANEWKPAANGIIFEGATADTIENYLTLADPATSDKTWTLPNVTGTLVTTGDTNSVTDAMTVNDLTIATSTAITRSSTTVGGVNNRFWNADTGGTSYEGVFIGNSSTLSDSLSLLAMSSGYTTDNSFVADGAALYSNTGLAGGLSIMARAGDLRLYAGGYTNASHLVATLSGTDRSTIFAGNVGFEGATADAYETMLTVVDPTADRTITFPNVTGTVVTTGDTGTVTSAMVASDLVNADIDAAAAIAETKLAITRTYWMPGGAIWPAASGGCSSPALDANNNVAVEFAASKTGYFGFTIPSNYDGSTANIVLYWYKGDTNAVSWTIDTVVFADNVVLTTTTPDSTTTTALTPATTNYSNNDSITDTDFFGASSNAGKWCRVKVSTNAFTGASAYLLGIKVEY